jgi:uncharacterized SAM-binding protein YcdF (DUF218 family)
VRPVIVIFGAAIRPDGRPSAAMRGRVEAALAQARGMDDPEFMPTGGQGRWGDAEAEVMAGLLTAAGVAPGRIWPVPTGANTIRSALACVRALREHDGPVYVATSAYHMPRCLTLLRLAGIPARPCRPSRMPASSRAVKRWYWRLRELAAIPVDLLLMLYFRLAGRL